MNNFLKAEFDFKNAVSINPNSYLGFIGIGDCHKFTHQYNSAIELYQRSLRILSTSK
jgi:tetratricopeptide (TPR) repeat protein